MAIHYHFGKRDSIDDPPTETWYRTTTFEDSQGAVVEMLLQAGQESLGDVIRLGQHGPSGTERLLVDPSQHYSDLANAYYAGAKACAMEPAPEVGGVEAFAIGKETWMVMTCQGAPCPGGDSYRPSRKIRKYTNERVAFARSIVASSEAATPDLPSEVPDPNGLLAVLAALGVAHYEAVGRDPKGERSIYNVGMANAYQGVAENLDNLGGEGQAAFARKMREVAKLAHEGVIAESSADRKMQSLGMSAAYSVMAAALESDDPVAMLRLELEGLSGVGGNDADSIGS